MRDTLNEKYGLTRLLPDDPLIDRKKYTVIEGEYTVLGHSFVNAHDHRWSEKPLYYELDGKGEIRWVYDDKPPGRSFKV